MKHIGTLLAALVFLVLIPVSADAQGALLATQQAKQEAAPAPVGEPSPNDLRELMRLLGDQNIVSWLRKNAENLGETDEAGTLGGADSLRDQLRAGLSRVQARIQALGAAWNGLSAVPHTVVEHWNAGMTPGETLRGITYVLIFLFVGAGLEWLYWQYFQAALIRIEVRPVVSLSQRFGSAVFRAILIGTALALFAIGSLGTFATFDWPPLIENIVLDMLLAVFVIRAISTASRFLLAPRVDDLRLVPLDGERARKTHNWILLVTVVTVLGIVVTDVWAQLSGEGQAGDSAVLAVEVAFAILAALAVAGMIWSLGGANGASVAHHTEGRFSPRTLKPVLFSALLLGVFALWLIDTRELMWTLAILGLLVPASSLVQGFVDHLYDRAEESPPAESIEVHGENETGTEEATEVATAEENPEEPDSPEVHRYDSYRPIVRRLARIALIVLAIIALGAAWGVNIFTLSEAPTLAGRIAGIALDIIVVVLMADLVWTWAKTAIDRRLADYVPPDPGQAPGPEARMATLLPIFRKILLATVIIMVGLTVLSSLGINVGPLLAGAGIVGIAIGFGAQALVKDIVSGIFFLLDDAFRIGEYIEMDNLRGTVESMSLRSLRVRHHRGAVHTIPFGELKSLTNYSRDWVIMKLEFRVPFETDLKLIKKIIKQVGAELKENEAYGHHLIEPLKSQGVRRMEEFNMVIGVKFMARPGAQWLIRRDAYQKVRDAFEKNGINFAQRNVKVEVIGDNPNQEEVDKAVAGAVQDAIEAKPPAGPAPDEP